MVSVRLQYLQCVSSGDTAVLLLGIDMIYYKMVVKLSYLYDGRPKAVEQNIYIDTAPQGKEMYLSNYEISCNISSARSYVAWYQCTEP